MYDAFYPGQVWLDTNGNRIQAHGGSLIYLDGVYYWYGENKEKTDKAAGIWHWGVRYYASTDLYNWEDRGLLIPPVTDDPNSSLHPTSMMDRPHIIYNARTKKYVCWLKIMEKDQTQTETVLTADSFFGPYTIVREKLRPLGMSAGDFDLAVAPDGKAYYFFERVHRQRNSGGRRCKGRARRQGNCRCHPCAGYDPSDHFMPQRTLAAGISGRYALSDNR